MNPRAARGWLRHGGWLAALAMLALAVRLAFPFWFFDDAYITFRYAANMADGRGLVYNEGERVLGTTTPLWALGLGLVAEIAGREAVPVAARGLAVVADVGTACLLYGLGVMVLRRCWAGGLLGAAFALAPDSVVHAGSGMEASLFSLLCLGALAPVAAGRLDRAAFVGALAMLTRPEGVLALLLVGAVWALRGFRPRRFSVWAAAGAALLLGWGAVATVYYGSPVPHSVAAKSVVFDPHVADGPARLLVWPNGMEIATWLGTFLTKSHSHKPWINLAQAVPMLALFGLGAWALVRRRRAWAVFPAFVALYALAYAWSGTLMFSWYFVPLVPGLLLTWFAGLGRLADWLSAPLARGRPWVRRARPVHALLLGCVVFTLAQRWWTMEAYGMPTYLRRQIIPGLREARYLEMARRLRARAEAVTGAKPFTVLTGEIGAIGWGLPDVRIIDFGALTSPEVLAAYRRGEAPVNLASPELVARTDPDFIVAVYPLLDARLRKDPEDSGYRLLHYERHRDWARKGLYVYERRAFGGDSAGAAQTQSGADGSE